MFEEEGTLDGTSSGKGGLFVSSWKYSCAEPASLEAVVGRGRGLDCLFGRKGSRRTSVVLDTRLGCIRVESDE